MTYHQELAQGRWQKMSLAEQIGNIGSEFARARKWEEKGELEQRQKALERALELIGLTLQSHPNKEIARLREVTADQYVQSKEYQISLKELEEYTLPFAVLARSNR